jgi:hypothetical protein
MDRANPSRSMPVTIPVATIVSEAVQSQSMRFIVGQDPQGRWHDALHYAVDLTGHRPDAVVIATDRIELRI